MEYFRFCSACADKYYLTIKRSNVDLKLFVGGVLLFFHFHTSLDAVIKIYHRNGVIHGSLSIVFKYCFMLLILFEAFRSMSLF